jgi:hypothetical protein
MLHLALAGKNSGIELARRFLPLRMVHEVADGAALCVDKGEQRHRPFCAGQQARQSTSALGLRTPGP